MTRSSSHEIISTLSSNSTIGQQRPVQCQDISDQRTQAITHDSNRDKKLQHADPPKAISTPEKGCESDTSEDSELDEEVVYNISLGVCP